MSAHVHHHAMGIAPATKADLLKRLARIRGQVDGIRRMVEDERYCPDIMQQFAAVRSGLAAAEKQLFANHLEGCATHGLAQGFGWFDERRPGLDLTLERARLALEADDGRPLLLFVQSYATHAPYRLRPSTRELLGERFSVENDFDRTIPDDSRDEFLAVDVPPAQVASTRVGWASLPSTSFGVPMQSPSTSMLAIGAAG